MRGVALWVLASAMASVALAQTPVVTPGGVVNAASFAPGQAVAPGSLVSIFGSELAAGLAQADSIPLSTSLGGVSVTFNNIPAPLIFVAPGQINVPAQINAQLPWNVLPAGQISGTVPVVVRRGNTASAPQNVQVGPVSPGIFQFGGQAIAINATNGSLAAPAGSIEGIATEPAAIGSAIIILGTGLGAVDGPIQSGHNPDALRNTTTRPTVLIGGREADVLFSGLSPQFVGVNQLNVVVPEGVTPGVVPLQIRMGVPPITTTDRVTIAVRPAGS